MKEINQLITISKFLQRFGFSFFVFIWLEAILIFTKYSSPGKLLYEKYGANGMSIYFAIIFAIMFILLAKSKKINDLAKTLQKNNTNIE